MVSSLRQHSQDAGKSQLQWGVTEDREKLTLSCRVGIEAKGKTKSKRDSGLVASRQDGTKLQLNAD